MLWMADSWLLWPLISLECTLIKKWRCTDKRLLCTFLPAGTEGRYFSQNIRGDGNQKLRKPRSTSYASRKVPCYPYFHLVELILKLSAHCCCLSHNIKLNNYSWVMYSHCDGSTVVDFTTAANGTYCNAADPSTLFAKCPLCFGLRNERTSVFWDMTSSV